MKTACMPLMTRTGTVLLLAALLALVPPSASADEPDQAPGRWQELYGDDGVVSLDMGAPVAAGEPIRGVLEFRVDYGVEQVKYQICKVGQSCFAIGVPLHQDPDDATRWTFDTADLPGELGRKAPTTYQAGQRIGVQFFVCTADDAPCTEDFFDWRLFPEGRDETHPSYDEDFVAWSETHYFAVDIQPGARPMPGPAVVWLLAAAVLAAGARARARRA